jgi:HEAT repeat protein
MKKGYLSRSRVYILLLFISFSNMPILATTWRKVTKTCPICIKEATANVPVSAYIRGSDPDYRPHGVSIVNSLLMCDRCGFTTYPDRFDNTEGLDKEKLKKALAQLETTPYFRKIDSAIVVEKNWKNDPQLIANLSLAAKWAADDFGSSEIITTRINQAIETAKISLEESRADSELQLRNTYLIGELNRQAGNRKEAIKWFEKAGKIADKLGVRKEFVLNDMQLFLTRYGEKSPEELFPIVKNASFADKIMSIKKLREIDNSSVITFLKQVCLHCPEDYREMAIRALVGDEPKKYHLPIFREGLLNDHYRTVQGSARAVEKLGDTNSAQIIVKALKNPVAFTDSGLFTALAYVATENEIDFLATQIDRGTEYNYVFQAFINTRSSKAIPFIKKMLKKDLLMGDFHEPIVYQRAAEFGPKLLGELPDLMTASDEDSAARFKIFVLGAMNTKEAEHELEKAVKRGDDLGILAALELARKGNTTGKELLVNRVERFRDRDSKSITYLYLILEPNDFEILYQKMENDKNKRKNSAIQSRKMLEEEFQSPDESMREYARQELDRLDRFEWNEDSFMTGWLLLLGATGNPKSRPILMKYLDSSKISTKILAIQGLSYVYSKSVGIEMARRIKNEDSSVKCEIIKMMGQVEDQQNVDVLMELLNYEMHIDSKIAWIKTMMKIAPIKAVPILERWSRSPNQELSITAQKASLKCNVK